MRRMHYAVLLALAAGVGRADTPTIDAPVAITDITIVAEPGQSFEHGTIVIENGRITAAGATLTIPLGARVYDGSGLVAYAGFIDALTRTGVNAPKADAEQERRVEDDFTPIPDGPWARTPLANRKDIFSHRSVEDLVAIDHDTFNDARGAGFTAALLAPPSALLGGSASVLQLGERPFRRSVLNGDIAQTASFNLSSRAVNERGRYPGSPIGAIAQLRQTLSDAAWYERMLAHAARHPQSGDDVPHDADLAALLSVIHGKTPVIWQADSADEINRALNLADEFGLRLVISGASQAYKVVDRLKATQTPVIVSLKLTNKPKEYKFDTKKLARTKGDDSPYGKNWDKRPFTPQAAYEEAKRVRDERVRNIVRLEEAGVRWALSTNGLKKTGDALKNLVEIIDAGLPADAALRALTVTPATLLGVSDALGAIAAGKRANLTVMTKPLGEKDAKVRWVFVDGKRFEFSPGAGKGDKKKDKAGRGRRGAQKPDAEDVDEADADEDADADQDADEKEAETKPDENAAPVNPIAANEPDWEIETDAERLPKVRTGGSVLLTNATVLTVSGDDLANTSVLIEDGKITNIGQDLKAPAGVRTIDVSGYTMMPGMIDPHSHIAADGINEGTLSVTPEVRVQDTVRSSDVSIYRAVAGGTTTAHVMHGSANSIGGQNVILKLKYGRPADELIVKDRQRTVKFALGENVTRSGRTSGRRFGAAANRGPARFPGSRAGVEATMRRAFTEAQGYVADLAAFKSAKQTGKDPTPVRRDLRLEALTEIMDGTIWVHSHCYRADEILRLLNVAEDFGFRIAVLQHVLEGYRIMPEIARHGCGTSTFADWWAYKLEAYNAVPQNAGMMLKYGINATVNSDSGDLIRHLNQEAAKCMKYSNLTANETLRLVTLNGARQLRMDDRIGSIEVGKDGDIAVFNGHPLDSFSKCVMTLVEGEIYFLDRDFDPDATKAPALDEKHFVAYGDAKSDGSTALRTVDTTIRPAALTGSGASNSAYAIINGTVHPISGPDMPNATVLIRDGKIEAIGHVLTVPDDAQVIDARGKHVWPGLINAATAVGMNEIGAVDVSVDTRETGTIQPDVLAVSELNPHSATVDVTRAEGVTTALLVPGSPTIAGQAGLVNLQGWTMDEMVINPRVGLVVNLPSTRPKPIVEGEPQRRGFFFFGGGGSDDAGEQVKQLAGFFDDARHYAKTVREAAEQGRPSPIEKDLRFDAMAPYALGEKPVLFNVNSYKAILEALLFAETHELKPIILGGREAWKLADLLAERHVPVIYEGTFAGPGRIAGVSGATERYDANYAALAVMAKAGVKFCLAAQSSSLAKNLAVNAGMAISHGLDPDVAIRAMTLNAAEILGISDTRGSLEVGKVADVIITTDHPSQATSVTTHVFVRGAPTSLESKHTRNAARFAARPAPKLRALPTALNGPPPQTSADRMAQLHTDRAPAAARGGAGSEAGVGSR